MKFINKDVFIQFDLQDVASQCGMKHFSALTFGRMTKSTIKNTKEVVETAELFVACILALMNKPPHKAQLPDEYKHIDETSYLQFVPDHDHRYYFKNYTQAGQILFTDRVINPNGPFVLYNLTKEKFADHWIAPNFYSPNPNHGDSTYVATFSLSRKPIHTCVIDEDKSNKETEKYVKNICNREIY